MSTDTTCRYATRPPDKPRKRLADVGGLYTEVSPNGSKRWNGHKAGRRPMQRELVRLVGAEVKGARDVSNAMAQAREKLIVT